MTRVTPFVGTLGLAALGTLAVLAGSAVPARGGGGPAGPATYEVTVTNLTAGQILSPLAVAAHDATVEMFRAGEPASDELATLAEEGDNGPLLAALAASPAVADAVSGTGMIHPGESETVTITTDLSRPLLSLAAMLVTTNDAFVGVDSFLLPARFETLRPVAYDAGSEANSELCAFVPGPPCGSSVHDPAPAEGFVHVHPGIHGVGDLAPADHDWRNPVARVTVRRVLR